MALWDTSNITKWNKNRAEKRKTIEKITFGKMPERGSEIEQIFQDRDLFDLFLEIGYFVVVMRE